MKTYHFGVKLQSRELNPLLRKTAMIVTGALCNKVVFVKYCPHLKVFQRNHAHNVKYYFPGHVLHG